MRFLSVEAVVALHRSLIEESGGSHGLRDAGLLESAVLRARNKADYDPDASIAAVGASFSFGLIKNHAFIDGNKRIGLAALLNFLGLNGLRLGAAKPDVLATVLRVASSEMSEDEWTAWVRKSVRPDTPVGP